MSKNMSNLALYISHWVSTEVLHFDHLSAHLPGDANWVRQMEWKHERRLIPFEGFDRKGNLQAQFWGLSGVPSEITTVCC